MAANVRAAGATANSTVSTASPAQESTFNFYLQAPPALLALITEFAHNAFDVERAEDTARRAFEYINDDPGFYEADPDTGAEALRIRLYRKIKRTRSRATWSEMVHGYVCKQVERCLTGKDAQGMAVQLEVTGTPQDNLTQRVAEPVAQSIASAWSTKAQRDALRYVDFQVRQMAYYRDARFNGPDGECTHKDLAMLEERDDATEERYDATSLHDRKAMARSYATENRLADPEWLLLADPDGGDADINENDRIGSSPERQTLAESVFFPGGGWMGQCDWYDI